MTEDSGHSKKFDSTSFNTSLKDVGLLVVEDLTDAELVGAVERIRLMNKRMEQENVIWMNFLQKSDPKLVRGIDKLLHYANVIAPSSLSNKILSQQSVSATHPGKTESLSSFASQSSNLSRRRSSMVASWMQGQSAGQHINYTMKLELLKREKEIVEKEMNEFMEKCKIRKSNLKSCVEETSLQLSEIREARELFEETVQEGVDLLTGRIPAEKFIRYMEEWLKSADSIIEKLRLKTCTLRYKYTHLKHQLAQKEELGESLHPVDFDQMRIENTLLMTKIEAKNEDLIQLKQKAGTVNLMLAKRTRQLQKQLTDQDNIKQQISDFHRKRAAIEDEKIEVEDELLSSKEKLERMKQLIENYSVPDLLDYVKIKQELSTLRGDVKVWRRRNHLQQIALESCIKTMKRLTGKINESESWFSYKSRTDDDDF